MFTTAASSNRAPSPYRPKRVLRLEPVRPGVPSAQAVKVARTIERIVKQTLSPFGDSVTLEKSQIAELQKTLRDMEAQLTEHEQANQELQMQLAERERDLREAEALLHMREAALNRREAAGQGSMRR
jgi:septal ring factor EnvC (AmiA/AmiB activator)